MTVWDDAAEADDFARAARQVLAKMSLETSKTSGDPQSAPATDGDGDVFSTPSGAFALARKGDAVALLLAAPQPVAPVLAAMLEAAHPRPRRASPKRRR